MEKKKGKSRMGSTDDGIPEAKYTRFGERIRQAIPGPMQCSVGCGGRNCKWENPARWSDADQAIKGVFSTWVLSNVVAMSRPSTEIIKKYKMIEQFKKHNIRSIINLQRPGEHASCGPPLEKESLFTYRPQEFMDNDIFFYNFGWKDYGVTSMDTILDMVKVMSFALEEGKVAVHCHAGLGRTGVLIACYLVYAERMDPAAAILKVRQHRSNSIQTRGQIACIDEFWHFLRPLRIIFPQVVPHAKRLTLKQFLIRQRHLLHGFESRDLRHTPKLMHEICKRMCHIAQADSKNEIVDISPPHSPSGRCSTVAAVRETLPKAFVNEPIEEPVQSTDPVIEILRAPPSNAEAVLSPRLDRKDTSRSVSSLDLHQRPQSACSMSRSLCDEDVPQSEKSTDESPTQDVKVAENRPVSPAENSSDPRSQDINKNFAEENENQIDIPDEQLERDVNEILGNTNNNHSVTGLSSVKTETNILNSANASPRMSDVEKDNSTELDGVSSEHSPSPDLSEQSQNPQASMRKIRRSAGRSETILPTGLPTINPRSSAKGMRPPVTGRDEVFESNSRETAENTTLDDAAKQQQQSGVPQGQTSDILPVSSATKVPVKVLVKNQDEPTSDTSNDVISVAALLMKNKPMFKVPEVDVILPTFTIGSSKNSETNDSDDEERMSASKSPRDELTRVKNDGEKRSASPSPILTSRPTSPIAKSQLPDLLPAVDVTQTMTSSNDDVETASLLSPRDIDLVDDAKSPSGSNLTSPRIEIKDLSDDDLDEIIDIPFDDDQRSMDGDDITQIESEDGVGNLSQSIASRVSWVSKQLKGASRLDRETSASSTRTEQSGRRTPLMYRAEKNLNLLSSDKLNGDDVTSKSSTSGENNRGSDVSEEEVGEGVTLEQEEANLDASNSALETDDTPRPESTLKLPLVPRINAARSLNDLSSPIHSDSPVTFSRCSSSGDMRHPSPHGHHQNASERINPTNVALAFSYKLIDDEWLWEKVYSLQVEINNHKDAWKSLAEVTDAYLLGSLMWSWVEHLSEPILAEKDGVQMLSIIEKSSPSTKPSRIAEKFEKALGSLEPSTSNTIKCLLSTVTSFPALARKISESMVERLLAAITLTPMPPAQKSPTNADLERVFQEYVSAKYAASNRKRFIDDLKQTVAPPSPKNVSRMPSTESEHSDYDEAFPVATEVEKIVRHSAGSVHSSGSSTNSISAQRIVVN